MANITYRQVADYMIPNLTLPPEETAICLGKWGMLHKDYIEEELKRTDNPQLLRKVDILQGFLNQVVRGLGSVDEVDAAYNEFENEEKRKEIETFASNEEIEPKLLTEFISEYEFSGTMDTGNIRDRIEKPLPLLKKKKLVERIVDRKISKYSLW